MGKERIVQKIKEVEVTVACDFEEDENGEIIADEPGRIDPCETTCIEK
jgi:hypothetical protein